MKVYVLVVPIMKGVNRSLKVGEVGRIKYLASKFEAKQTTLISKMVTVNFTDFEMLVSNTTEVIV